MIGSTTASGRLSATTSLISSPSPCLRGVEPGPPNKLIDHPDLEIPKPTVVGMAGFAFFWLMVYLMIRIVYWLSGLGA